MRAVAASSDSPTVVAVPASAQIGQQLALDGRGWNPGEQVFVAVCGRRAMDLSADCAQDAGVISAAMPDGTLRGLIYAAKPPVPCPCVLLASSLDSGHVAMGDLVLPGVKTVALPAEAQKSEPVAPLIESVHLVGGTRWQEWFGAAPKRTLVVTLRNPANSPTRIALTASRGRDAQSGDFAASANVASLAPRTDLTMRVTVTLAPFALGTYHVHGVADGTSGSSRFDTTTRVIPAAAFGLLALIALYLLRAFRALARRALGRSRQNQLATARISRRSPRAQTPKTSAPAPTPSRRKPQPRQKARHRRPPGAVAPVPYFRLEELLSPEQDTRIPEWSNA
jgi:hypothetical protein